MTNLPDWLNPTQHIIRMPVNEYDKSTVVSILPKSFDERKHTIMPNRFQIEPGSFEKPMTLVVGPASWWKDTGDGQPLLEIVSPSVVVADSLVKDYCNGYLCSNGDEAGPGLFWIPGAVDLTELNTKYKPLLAKAHLKQTKWFQNLVRAADALWSRSHGNPQVIADDMRIAAQQLGLVEKKDWMSDFKMQSMELCPACGFMVNPNFPVCSNCKSVINEKLAIERGIKFAKVG